MNKYKNTGIRSPYNRTQREHFFMIDNDYVKLYAKHLGVMATAVFTSLNMHADASGICFPSMQLIAEQHGIDRHTVSRALKELEKWNIINTERAIDRKLRKRKNNVYELLPKELWKKPPVEDEDDGWLGGYCADIVIDEDNFWAWNDVEEDGNEDTTNNDSEKSHGNKDTTHMASKIPDDGIEDTSNKTHIITTIEENSLCGEPTELPLSLSNKLQLLKSGDGVSGSAVWNSDQAIQALMKSGYKDYQIIGAYFYMQQYSFSDRPACVKAIERSLRAAKALEGYKIDDIRKTMQWLNEYDFDYSEPDISWSLEAVIRYVDDCIATNFIPDGDERTKQLKIINA